MTWYTIGGPDMGEARVYVDGTLRRTVDLYNPTVIHGDGYSIEGLPLGHHNVRVAVTGEKDPASTATTVVVDGFVVQ